MRRAQDIAAEEKSMRTILTLTGAFEGLSSMRIAQIKNQVLESRDFFADLWQMYSQLRVDQLFNYGREKEQKVINKDLFIGITAEGGFSGDIDQRLIDLMLKGYDPAKQDIIIIGHHGAVQLSQRGVAFIKYFRLPTVDKNINVTPLVQHIQEYKTTSVFYQSYTSLMVQDIKKVDLHSAVQAAGTLVNEGDDIITEINYIFEPSSYAVIAHLERIMLQISLSQMILESKLAQHASRYRAMSSAQQLALDTSSGLRLEYNRVRRAVGDQRLKEVTGGMKVVRSHQL
ncbi:MAG: atpG [Candidatus Saccharibacteria bacterium]|nr:atpG [Candidatus Saccharibacteria bacterium]